MIRFFSFTTAKRGSSESESDDKIFCLNIPVPTVEGKKYRTRFAVADGATECSFSKLWADILVKDYCKLGHKTAGGLERYLNKLSKKWSQKISTDDLPWYAQEKVKNGAFSTLLGSEFEGLRLLKKQMAIEQTARSGKWSAIAVGDSCIFQIRENTIVKSFPLEKSTDFNNRPVLLSSDIQKNEQVLAFTQSFQGAWKNGDEFYLCTDAFAAWFLSEHEKGHSPWIDFREVITDPEPDKKFLSWVNSKRESGLLKNDDTSVICFKL